MSKITKKKEKKRERKKRTIKSLSFFVTFPIVSPDITVILQNNNNKKKKKNNRTKVTGGDWRKLCSDLIVCSKNFQLMRHMKTETERQRNREINSQSETK